MVSTYCDAVERRADASPNNARVFADIALKDADSADWREFPSQEAMAGRGYEGALVWMMDGTVVLARFSYLSRYADWVHYVDYCFGEDGALGEAHAELRTFNGNVRKVRNIVRTFDGGFIEVRSEVFDLLSGKPITPPGGGFLGQDVPLVRSVGELPFVRLLGVSGGIATAQESVTPTSGDPASIAHIRATFAEVERDAPRYRRTTHHLWGLSTEGGVVDGFYDGGGLRKLHARLFFESGRRTVDYYFSGGRLVFIYDLFERYDQPLSGRVQMRIEHRLYLDEDRLIRRSTQSPLRRAGELSPLDLQGFLTESTFLAACAAQARPDPPECAPPGR